MRVLVWRGFLKFTDEEVERMPKEFAGEFAVKYGSTAHCDKWVVDDEDGETAHFEYEVYFKKGGCVVVVTDKDLMKAKRKFILALFQPNETTGARAPRAGAVLLT